MRKYPNDSVEAAARIVALALMADGAIDRNELLLLERQQIVGRLGLDNEQFDAVYYEYCTDMLTTADGNASGLLELNEQGIDKVLGEIRDPALQKKILRIMLDILSSDHRLTASEAALIARALKCWDLDLCEMSESSIPRHCSPPQMRRNPCLAGGSSAGGSHHVATG